MPTTRTESRLGGPTPLGTTTTTIATASAGVTEVVKQLLICNTDTIERTFSLAVGTAATATNRFFSSMPIGANDTIVLDTAIVLAPTETLQGLADTANKVVVIAIGWEKTTS